MQLPGYGAGSMLSKNVFTPAPAHLFPAVRRFKEFAERLRERFHIVLRDEVAGFSIPHDFGNIRVKRRNHREAHVLRLNEHRRRSALCGSVSRYDAGCMKMSAFIASETNTV